MILEVNRLQYVPNPLFYFHLSWALLLGLLIGLERQIHHRVAGLRTTALVTLGSALFSSIPTMLISPSTDLLRIASTVVTGVGFLGGGILLREGVSTSSVRVKGINTAATLWCAAAVGAASGLGLWTQAGFATGLLLVVNIVLRILVKKFDRPMVEE